LQGGVYGKAVSIDNRKRMCYLRRTSAAIFVPLVIVYQFLVYRFFRAKVTRTQVSEESGSY
jgi:cytochrome bd-type quinol oxidase subunit 2